MKPQIIFIINCITQRRCLKRVQEFMDNGYEVSVYGFERKDEKLYNGNAIQYELLGCISNEMSFANRLKYVYDAVKPIFRKHGKRDVIYYIFSLDIALSCMPMLRGVRYIYEESDMMHTYVGNRYVRNILESFDKYIIRKSLRSVLTSAGFAEYHWGTKWPQNVSLITNRLDKDIVNYPVIAKQPLDMQHLHIGFVGMVRSDSVCKLAEILLNRITGCEVHFYGDIPANFESLCTPLRQYPNCYFHGKFRNPDDLPEMYANMDVLLSTYDARSVNVQYAEPNKLYEAMYFETPIVVSSGTFLARKVQTMGIGFEVDVHNPESVDQLIAEMNHQAITDRIAVLKRFNKKESINTNEAFFATLESAYAV